MRLIRLCFSHFLIREKALLFDLIMIISFKEHPSLYDIISRPLKAYHSNGWFSISCHLLVLICYKLGTDGLYCVTKIPLFAFCFCWKQLVCSGQSSLIKRCCCCCLFFCSCCCYFLLLLFIYLFSA